MLFNKWILPGSSVAEQVTVNHLVAGSIPARAAILTRSYKTPAGSEKATYVESYVGRRLHFHSQTFISGIVIHEAE